MKKEEIYVVIDSEEKRLKVLEILEKAGEEVWKHSILNLRYTNSMCISLGTKWGICGTGCKTKITLDQLEEILLTSKHLTLVELQQQAEALGYELVEKKRDPKVGDFGAFNNDGNENWYTGFLADIEDEKYYMQGIISWDNFRHLTEEEKQKIQENW